MQNNFFDVIPTFTQFILTKLSHPSSLTGTKIILQTCLHVKLYTQLLFIPHICYGWFTKVEYRKAYMPTERQRKKDVGFGTFPPRRESHSRSIHVMLQSVSPTHHRVRASLPA